MPWWTVINAQDWADVLAQLSRIERKIDALTTQGAREMAGIADVRTAVTAQTSVVSSVVTLLEQLKSMLDAAIAADDPAAIQAVSDAIAANTQALANAVTTNTPVR